MGDICKLGNLRLVASMKALTPCRSRDMMTASNGCGQGE